MLRPEGDDIMVDLLRSMHTAYSYIETVSVYFDSHGQSEDLECLLGNS